MVDRLANYEPVQARIGRFWADHPDGRIDCELLERDDKHCLAKATVWTIRTNEAPSAVGYAAEVHDGSPVNRQGWMIENAETSAIGRALANLGYSGHAGSRPTEQDMGRVETRTRQEIVNDQLAKVTFDRLKMIAGTELAETLKDMAAENDRKLSHADLKLHPDWRVMVDEALDRDAD